MKSVQKINKNVPVKLLMRETTFPLQKENTGWASTQQRGGQATEFSLQIVVAFVCRGLYTMHRGYQNLVSFFAAYEQIMHTESSNLIIQVAGIQDPVPQDECAGLMSFLLSERQQA